MDEVKFSDQSYQPQTTYVPPTEKGLVGWLVKRKIAKNAKQANLVMIGIVVICLIIITILLKSRGSQTLDNNLPAEEQEIIGNKIVP